MLEGFCCFLVCFKVNAVILSSNPASKFRIFTSIQRMSLDLSRWENRTLQWNRERSHWNSFRGFCWAVRSKQTVYWFLFCALMSTIRFVTIYIILYFISTFVPLTLCYEVVQCMPVLFTAWPVWWAGQFHWSPERDSTSPEPTSAVCCIKTALPGFQSRETVMEM